MINIIIPMAGEGKRFKEAGYSRQKPFIDVSGKMMIDRVLENLKIDNAKYILLVRGDDAINESRYFLEIGKRINVEIIFVEKLTEGSACTVLLARNFIDNEEALLIANSDQIVDIDISLFIYDCIKRNLDGSILTFLEKKRDKKWSYVRTDSDGFVVEVKEKIPISELATVGIYYFSKGRFFVDYAIEMIKNNDRVNNEFYTCPVFNYAIKDGKKIGVFTINNFAMHGLGTPEDLIEYINYLKKP